MEIEGVSTDNNLQTQERDQQPTPELNQETNTEGPIDPTEPASTDLEPTLEVAIADETSNELQVSLDYSGEDEDGFISIWQLAEASLAGPHGHPQIRTLASRMLNFACKHQYPYAVITQHDIDYLEELLERDPTLLGSWSPDSEKTDLVSQFLKIPADAFIKFLQFERFDPYKNYTTRRSTKTTWFNDGWGVE
ncbi:MAG: hypothetical protein MPJ24_07555 [Pirellulaceae bacterium]|nr:hypothetical protein [Pirellulaceae bacterium]